VRLQFQPLDLGRFCRCGGGSFKAVEEVDEDRLVVKVALGEKGPGDDAEFVAEGAKDGLHPMPVSKEALFENLPKAREDAPLKRG
jgi:hypothetical protein